MKNVKMAKRKSKNVIKEFISIQLKE